MACGLRRLPAARVRRPPPTEQRAELVLLLVARTLPPARRFFFMQLDLQHIALSQPELHGLLGQRAVEPPAVLSSHAGLAELARARASLGSSSGQARGGGSQDAANLRLARQLFGPQGEGAIEGRSEEYDVGSLDAHQYAYSQWRCP